MPEALLDDDYLQPVTCRQFEELLQNAVHVVNPDAEYFVEYPEGKEDNDPLNRQEGASMLYRAAADGLGISESNGAALNYNSEYCFWEETENIELEDFDALYFAVSHYDLTEDARLMETTSDGKVRPFDDFTRAEAICSVWRLTRSIPPEVSYVSMDDIVPMELTGEELERARKQPLPAAEKLPAWRGISLEQQHSSDQFTYGTKYFGEMQMYALSDLGFNFTRVPLNFYGLFEDESTMRVDANKIENLDMLVRLGIQYGVHICFDFHSLPGYQSTQYGGGQADKTDDFWTNPEKQDQAMEVFAFLAQHYRNVPSNALSFNPLNEPMAGEGYVDGEGEAYAEVAKRVIETVRAQDPQRFMIFDGIRINAGAPSRVPVEELIGEDVAQAFHYYGEDCAGEFVNNAQDFDAYSPQGWPLPFANGFLAEDVGPLSIQGSFPAGMQVRLNITAIAGLGRVQILADGQDIGGMDIPSHEEGVNDCLFAWEDGSGGDYNLDVSGELTQPASEIQIRFDPFGNLPDMGSYWMLQMRIAELTWPGETDKLIPYYRRWDGLTEMRNRKVTNIICAPYGIAEAGASVIKVDGDGIYSNAEQEEFAFNIDRIRDAAGEWAKFSGENHVAIMVQEFGVGSKIRGEIANAYLDDFLTVLDEYEIPWCMWGYWEDFGIFFDGQADAVYGAYGPYLMNTEKTAILQKHCIKQ